MNAKKHEVPEALLVEYKKPEDLIGENGLLKLLVDKALDAELTAPRPRQERAGRQCRR